ncbi:MAG TPA: redoxin domain-containing protein, partial [Polyangiaceae bacterium]|nr:redoxin domain-containing protein [Polyangiaceae bacterium]
GGAGAGGSSTGTGGTGTGTPETQTRATVSGDVTWNVVFDADAQAAGATDCSYTRHYEGVQDDSAKWLCPQCEVMFRADVQMTEGQTDCFMQISEGLPATLEWIGWGNGVYYRGLGARMSEQGTAAVDGVSVSTTNAVMDLEHAAGGLFGFDIAGSFTLGEEEGDPMHGFAVPDTYACGWPKADPAPYEGDYTIEVGQPVPDGIFKDSCEETVRLHDFQGSYLFVDMSAMDCPPCQQMASGEEAFVASLAGQGIEVHVITLLTPSLADPLGETTTTMLEQWISTYNLQSPVLADRGWGLTMFLEVITDLGYPSWVLVAPDLTVIEFGSGFAGWSEREAAVLEHASSN